MEIKKALIIIDYTYDFVADKGLLTVGKPAQALEKNIVALSQKFLDDNQFIVIASDNHHKNDKYHPETKLFPPHNIEGSSGQKLYGTLEDFYQENKDKENIYYIKKTRYSAFCGTDLFLKLRERNINELHLTGVCTDICVLHTAIDAYNLGFKIVIHEDSVSSFNSEGHKWALNHFKNCLGAEIISQLIILLYKNEQKLKPFLKWAGGKRQLLNEIRKYYPVGLGNSIFKYAEPFVGSGAVLFDVLSNYDIYAVL